MTDMIKAKKNTRSPQFFPVAIFSLLRNLCTNYPVCSNSLKTINLTMSIMILKIRVDELSEPVKPAPDSGPERLQGDGVVILCCCGIAL
jgi:hypothetical protein